MGGLEITGHPQDILTLEERENRTERLDSYCSFESAWARISLLLTSVSHRHDPLLSPLSTIRGSCQHPYFADGESEALKMWLALLSDHVGYLA